MEKDNIITEESEFKKNAIRIIKGSIFAIITSAILLLIFAVLLCYTNLSESTMLPVILVITGISILIGTRKIRKNGILNGGMVGVIYIITLYLISSLFLAGFNLTFNSFIMLIIGIITGMIGGIIGVNTNRM